MKEERATQIIKYIQGIIDTDKDCIGRKVTNKLKFVYISKCILREINKGLDNW